MNSNRIHKSLDTIAEIRSCSQGVVEWVNNHGSSIGMNTTQISRLDEYGRAADQYHEQLILNNQEQLKTLASSQGMGM